MTAVWSYIEDSPILPLTVGVRSRSCGTFVLAHTAETASPAPVLLSWNGHRESTTPSAQSPPGTRTLQFQFKSFSHLTIIVGILKRIIQMYIIPQKYPCWLRIQKPDTGSGLAERECQHSCRSAFLHKTRPQTSDQSHNSLHGAKQSTGKTTQFLSPDYTNERQFRRFGWSMGKPFTLCSV